MATCVKLKVNDADLTAALQQLYRSIMASPMVDQILVPMLPAHGSMVMPTLIDDPEMLAATDPLAPAFPLNGAKMVCRLTRTDAGGMIAAAMRPCEIRAFVELVKLKQGSFDKLIIIGMDCLGAFQNTDYLKFAGANGKESTRKFYTDALAAKPDAPPDRQLAPACRVCDQPTAANADVAVALWGIDWRNQILVYSQTETGDRLLESLGLETTSLPEERQSYLEAMLEKRAGLRRQMYAETTEATNGLDKLGAYFAACVNCYNCRVACPVCYCRECVFLTDAFDHEPSRYMAWARRKKAVKMPTDTIFYHLTRLAHMSLACVGCGQCSNACPNDIPLAELFCTVAADTQKSFDYKAGNDPGAKPPLTEFRENEFSEIVGID